MLQTDVSQELRELRIRAGFTQEELAEILMTTAPAICRFEKGNRVPDAVTYINWKHVCTHKSKKFLFNIGEDGSKVLQLV